MSLGNTINDYVNAGFSGLWIVTREPDEAERDLLLHARSKQWQPASWNSAQGVLHPNGTRLSGTEDPGAVLDASQSLFTAGQTGLLLLHNLHRYLNSPEMVQRLFNCLLHGKRQGIFYIVLAPSGTIPPELEKLFVILEHDLPTPDELAKISQDVAGEDGVPPDSPAIRAATGLTRYEAEGAFALSLSRHNTIRPEVIWELKAQALKKNGMLTLHRGKEKFDDLGGLSSLKGFCNRALTHHAAGVQPRGVLLLGVPGTGKSAFAKALGNETGRPTLVLDLGALYGSLVGQTEANVRQALKVADAMAPCILFVDEIEKALAGVGGQGDSGVSTRLFGTLLTWLSDHVSDVFFIATCNKIAALPPEFSRAERFDRLYFIDLPGRVEKDMIWDLYLEQFKITKCDGEVDDTDWTGAEIKACCRTAALLGCSAKEASDNIAPVAQMAAEQIQELRSWASLRCADASKGGKYQKPDVTLNGSVATRKITRSHN